MFGVATDDGDRDCWATPHGLFEPLDREFSFTWDLAAEDWSAKCEQYLTPDDDALSVGWWELDGWLFLNPPFSELAVWLARVKLEAAAGARIVVVVPGHRHEQEWFQRYVIGVAHEVRCPRQRVSYSAPPGIPASSPTFPSMVLVYDGPNPEGRTELMRL